LNQQISCPSTFPSASKAKGKAKAKPKSRTQSSESHSFQSPLGSEVASRLSSQLELNQHGDSSSDEQDPEPGSFSRAKYSASSSLTSLFKSNKPSGSTSSAKVSSNQEAASASKRYNGVYSTFTPRWSDDLGAKDWKRRKRNVARWNGVGVGDREGEGEGEMGQERTEGVVCGLMEDEVSFKIAL